MAANIDKERAAIAAEESKLAERRKRLAEMEQTERHRALGKSVLMKVDGTRLDSLLRRMGALGMDEVEKRLAS